MNIRIIRTIVERFPTLIPHLGNKARWIASMTLEAETKTAEFFQNTLERMIVSVYNNRLGGEFIDIMANLVSGQLRQAVERAWADEGGEGVIPGYLNELVMSATLRQFSFVDQLFRDIIDARLNETPLAPLLARAPLWANRWTETYNEAIALIVAVRGGNLIWKLGKTEEHCTTCARLNGIVAGASEWQMLGVQPQAAPNPILECGGWRCDCSLLPTSRRRSPRAFEDIMGIVSR